MKKFKLLASIASMCLAIAVLCFGVFAASTVTYTISGTISYEVSDVFVNLTTTVYSCDQKLTTEAMNTLAGKITDATAENQTVDTTTLTYVTDKTGTYKNDGGAVTGIIAKDADNIKIDKASLALSYSNVGTKQLTYFIVTKIDNLANKALKVTCGAMAAIANSNLGSKTIESVAANGSGVVVYAMSVNDLTVGIPSADFTASITFAYGA